MSKSVADRNLLFGVLAFQMDFVTREQLIAAMQAWVFNKDKSLGEILASQKALDQDSRQLLEALVQKHLALHDNDAQKSLESVSSVGSVKRELNDIADEELQASLTVVGVKKQDDPYGTIDPSASTLTPPGSALRFRILRPHAKGGLGEVFVAKDQELHREVALKEIQHRQADNLQSRARFMLEAEITGGLEHPGIVPVYSLGTYSDGRPFYAMRYIRGDSLKDAVDRFHRNDSLGMDPGLRALEERRLLGRFIDVCDAIGYAHSRGVLHRDLKPGNIMLGKYGETLVVDWGLAKPLGSVPEPRGGGAGGEPGEGSLIPSSLSAGSATIAGSALGTPQYMSPEQAAGKIDQLGPAADIYSLGATLYSLLAGRPPIPEGKLGDILQKVQRGDITPLRQLKPGVHPALEAICMKALALNPQDRYATARALANDVEHWLADEPVSAWREPWTVRTRRWVKRHRTLVSSMSAAVLVALVGFAVATVLLAEANERERAAKIKAEENFQLARQAVDRYHTEVSQNVILHEPMMEPLRRKLLEAAKEYYEKFRQERAGDPSVRAELGKATFRLAQIVGDIESEHKAIELHNEAAKLLANPDSTETKSDLAACYHHLGRLYRLTDQTDQSQQAYGQALKEWNDIVAQAKEDRYIAGQARTQLGLGNERQLTRKLDEAEKLYQEALASRKTLAVKNAKTTEYQRELAVSHNNLALIYKTAGKAKDAEQALRSAIDIEKKLADAAPHISQYQQDLARTYLLLGELTNAEEPLQQAVELRRGLVKRHPEVLDFQATLGDALVQLAGYYRDAKELAKAEAAAHEAVKLQRKLADANAKVANYRGDLGRGLAVLGDVERLNGKTVIAKKYYDEAITVLDPPARELPKVPHYQSELARVWNSLGRLYAQETRGEQATEAFTKARALWEKLVADHPDETEYALGLSATCFNLGNQAFARKDFKEALPWYTKAVQCATGKRMDGPRGSALKNALCNSHGLRAETLVRLGRGAESLEDWERALEHARAQQKPAFQFQHALTLARLGRHADAAKEADELVTLVKQGADCYRFATLYALAASAADNAIDQTPDQRKESVGALLGKALKLMENAREEKFFKVSSQVERLKTDADLEWLRARPEFLSFLKTLDAK